MIDLFQALVKSPLQKVSINSIHPSTSGPMRPDENFSAQLTYADGSLCNLIYTSMGNPLLSKEYLEIYWEGKSALLNDFSKLTIFDEGEKSFSSKKDKGHLASLEIFLNSVSNGLSFPTPWADLFETTGASIELDRELWGQMKTPAHKN